MVHGVNRPFVFMWFENWLLCKWSTWVYVVQKHGYNLIKRCVSHGGPNLARPNPTYGWKLWPKPITVKGWVKQLHNIGTRELGEIRALINLRGLGFRELVIWGLQHSCVGSVRNRVVIGCPLTTRGITTYTRIPHTWSFKLKLVVGLERIYIDNYTWNLHWISQTLIIILRQWGLKTWWCRVIPFTCYGHGWCIIQFGFRNIGVLKHHFMILIFGFKIGIVAWNVVCQMGWNFLLSWGRQVL